MVLQDPCCSFGNIYAISVDMGCIFRWGTHFYMSFFLSVCPSICHTPHLRNHMSFDHTFWCTYVKCWYLLSFYFFAFHFLKILIFWAVREVKGQKIAQNEKQQLHLSSAISQEQYSIWSWFLVYMCKMVISPGLFFIFFFKFWFFG